MQEALSLRPVPIARVNTSLAAAGLILLIAGSAPEDRARPVVPQQTAAHRHAAPAHRPPVPPREPVRSMPAPPTDTAWTLPAALLVLLGSGAAPFLRRWHRTRRRRRASALLRTEIERSAQMLRVRRLQLLGAERKGSRAGAQRWEKEKRRFCDTRLRPVLNRRGWGGCWTALETSTLRRIEQVAWRGRNGPPGFDPGMHPLEYERFCARLLEKAGWRTALTPAGGDQGADILAERNGCRLVVQCKLYRGAVGNDAVQQVAAARAHRNAQAAIVVSNARFTAAAEALARSNRVALLHHEELPCYRFNRAASDTIASATR